MTSKQLIKEILTKGTQAEKQELFKFNKSMSPEKIAKKFKIFARGLYPRYFHYSSPEAHDEWILNMVRAYLGLGEKPNYLNIASRGLAKTALAKLFVAFVLLADEDAFRKYLKVLSLDGKNSKQVVTDIYNLMVEAEPVYGDVFQKEGKLKQEETMSSFTLRVGRKLAAGTVGQTQRGHIQDAYRPDFIWFDDVEDRSSISSITITQNVVDKMSEAIDGLSKGGTYMVTANYISDQGTIEWVRSKTNVMTTITPIADYKLNPIWPERDTKEDIIKLEENAEDFSGEYMCDPNNQDDKFFDLAKINADLQNVREPSRTSAGVRYWIDYVPNHRFGQGSDHSDGVGKDANTLAGFDFNTGELAYTYHNNMIKPDLAAHEFARVGGEYGNCIWAPENNNRCGGIVVATVSNLNYPRVYTMRKNDKGQEVDTGKVGWETNTLTKRTAFFEFRTDYNDGLVKIYDKDVLDEMKAFSNSDLDVSRSKTRSTSTVTRHFDLLQAVVIAWQMKKYAMSTKKVNLHFEYDKYGRPSVKKAGESFFGDVA